MLPADLPMKRPVKPLFALPLLLALNASGGELSRSLVDVPHPALADLAALRLPPGSRYFGGTVRPSDNFLVWARTHPRDAEWAARELQAAWTDISTLSDYWTAQHRDPEQHHGPIPVVVDSRPHRQRLFDSTCFAVENGLPMIYINAAANQPRLQAQLESVRAAAAQSFLFVNDQDYWLPPWVQEGLAAYIGRTGNESATADGGAGQLARNAQIEFLLDGADSKYAPELFASLKQTLPSHRRPLPNHPARLTRLDIDNYRLNRQPTPRATFTPLDALWARADLQESYTAWKNDPHDQLPVFEPSPGLANRLQRRQREMMLILKLMRRFGWPDRAEYLATETNGLGENGSLGPFYHRLAGPEVPLWATRDVNGELLLSNDRQRIDELFSIREQRYQVVHRDGRTVLVNRWNADTTLEGWLEDNPRHPGRPIAQIEAEKIKD